MKALDLLTLPFRTMRAQDQGDITVETARAQNDSTVMTPSLPALTVETARTVPIVGAMMTAVANTFISMEVQTATANARRILATSPSANWTGPALWGWAGAEVVLKGRALVEIERRNVATGRVMNALYPAVGAPLSMLERPGSPQSAYRLVRIGETRQRVVPVSEVLELSSAVPPKGVMDTPAARAVALLRLMDDALTGVIDGGFLVRFLLMAANRFRDGQLEDIASQFAKSFSRGVGGAAVPIAIDGAGGAGDGGMRVEQLSPDLRAAQVDEISQSLERRVLTHVGFPAEYTSKSAEIKDLRLIYRMVVLPIAVLFAAEVRRKTGVDMEFNPRNLLRGDPQERRAYYQAALGAPGKPGWLSQNRVRELEGEPEHPDERADQLNFGDQQVMVAPGMAPSGDGEDDDDE